jgi:hypothetical protein
MNLFRRLKISASVALLAAIGCHKPYRPPPPLPQPTTLFTVDSYLGNLLSGPTAGNAPVALPDDALAVHVTFLALELMPSVSYSPVGAQAVFFSSSGDGGGGAILPAGELTRNATIGQLKFPEDLPADLRAVHAGRITAMATLDGALPPGVTAEFTALDPETASDSDARRCVQVLVSRPANPTASPQIALVLKDTSTDIPPTLRTEKAVFDLPHQDRTNTALVVPFRFDSATSRAVAILIQISPGNSDASHIAATVNTLTRITTRLSTTQPALATGEADAWSAVNAAVQSLSPAASRRSSLAFLADQTGATLCEDLAMEADDTVLAQLVTDIQAKVANKNNSLPDPNVGWLLDHTALQLLAKLSDDAANGNGKISPELLAVLTTHTGEVGRHSSSLSELLRGLSTRDELTNRLLAGNLIFLEDSSPASRVRAFDWLSARHHAPAGYDPLGPGKARREALERAAGAP